MEDAGVRRLKELASFQADSVYAVLEVYWAMRELEGVASLEDGRGGARTSKGRQDRTRRPSSRQRRA